MQLHVLVGVLVCFHNSCHDFSILVIRLFSFAFLIFVGNCWSYPKLLVHMSLYQVQDLDPSLVQDLVDQVGMDGNGERKGGKGGRETK